MAVKSPKLSKKQVRAFHAQIWAFYGHSGRKLPWRNTQNPYKILISEVMLQQTQVARVLEKYPRFLKVFPTIQSLAKSSLSDVLRTWQGMGYNRRARYLRDAALTIVSDYNSKLPKKEKELLALPGVGHYTANAILAFSHNEPRVMIETNIRRIFIHHFFKNKKNVSDKDILLLVEQTLDKNNPRGWYYALMDYGAQLPQITKQNSNIRSKNYARQSIFKGSNRELRGKIIRTLIETPATLLAIQKICEKDKRVEPVLIKLLEENLIIYEKSKYKLA